jgi:hypothetical protein
VELSKPKEANSREILTRKETFTNSCQSRFNDINYHRMTLERVESPAPDFLRKFELSIPQLTFQVALFPDVTLRKNSNTDDCAQQKQQLLLPKQRMLFSVKYA